MATNIVKKIISVYDNGRANLNELFRDSIGLSNQHSSETGIYWRIGETIANREAILPMIDRSGSQYVIVFDDYTEGQVKYSDVAYGLAIRDVKMIFLTGKDREPGNSLLEALVNVGQYDIVRSNHFTPDIIYQALSHPKKFVDVSPMARKLLTSDLEDEKVFDLPEIKKLRMFTERIDADFLKSDYDPSKIGKDHVTAKDPKSLKDAFTSALTDTNKKPSKASSPEPKNLPEDDDLDDTSFADDLDF